MHACNFDAVSKSASDSSSRIYGSRRSFYSSQWKLKVTPDFGYFKKANSASIYCLNVTNDATKFANNVQWIRIFSDARITIWSNDHRLYFPSLASNDEGSYCCRISQPLRDSANLSLHGCTGYATARISIVAPLLANSTQKNASGCMVDNNSDSHAVVRSLDTGKSYA